MTTGIPHLCVCICTYKRLPFLKRLLTELAAQETDDLFTYSVVVADNDRERSAQRVVDEFAAAGSPMRVRYCVQPQQNIALTRNTAIAHADGDFIAFIDDDEWPIRRWLLTLFTACRDCDADGALGPVKPHFDEPPPTWVITGKFYARKVGGFAADFARWIVSHFATGQLLMLARYFHNMATLTIHFSRSIAAFFVLSMLSLIGSYVCLLREIFIATHTHLQRTLQMPM